ncbi:MAG: GNAT family N-acetyltransferase [Candidatus Methylarchaceae archaeon HK02M2]|nr:GNAT family N-acetyltransferase [Candidatus Methylarchaceae archaeon HK02M2]
MKKKEEDEIEIRDMVIDDLPKVFHIGEEIFTSERFPLMYRTWDQFEITSLYTGDAEFCIVAEKNGEVVGFAMATFIEKSRSAWKYGYVAWLGVKKRYHRHEIGAKLYREIEKRLRKDGARMIIVDTEEGDIEALNFFKKMGFNSTREHIWMTKTFK